MLLWPHTLWSTSAGALSRAGNFGQQKLFPPPRGEVAHCSPLAPYVADLPDVCYCFRVGSNGHSSSPWRWKHLLKEGRRTAFGFRSKGRASRILAGEFGYFKCVGLRRGKIDQAGIGPYKDPGPWKSCDRITSAMTRAILAAPWPDGSIALA